MPSRSDLKEASLQRILAAGSVRIRQEGLSGAAIAPVMQDAGLTHGAFYAHFANKEELAEAAFRFALKENRPRWIGRPQQESWRQRLLRLGRRYLTGAHCEDLRDSCALAALSSDAGRGSAAFKSAYQEELQKSLAAICGAVETTELPEHDRQDDAIAFMALCVGGISLARAVADPELAERILAVCRDAVARLVPEQRLDMATGTAMDRDNRETSRSTGDVLGLQRDENRVSR